MFFGEQAKACCEITLFRLVSKLSVLEGIKVIGNSDVDSESCIRYNLHAPINCGFLEY